MKNKNNKSIGIDTRMIGHSGIGTRIFHILKLLRKLPTKKKIILFGNPKKLEEFHNDYEILEYDPPIYSIKETMGENKLMKYCKVLDIPHFNVPLRYLNNCIVTIHDIIPYKMNEYHDSLKKQLYLRLILNSIKKFSKKIITVSEYTKKDLIESFQYKADSIEVIYNAVDHSIFIPQSEDKKKLFREKYKLPKKYFLTVGIGKEHKNLRFVVKNLSNLWLRNESNIPLVMAGSNGKVPDSIKDLYHEFKDFLITFPKISFTELPLLYACAFCLIFPSLYEGFGFPILEAQAVGCPVLSSNASVLPEIVRDSAYYFSPQDDMSFIHKINELLNNSKSIDKYKSIGIENAQRFQWEKSVERIAEIYDSFS